MEINRCASRQLDASEKFVRFFEIMRRASFNVPLSPAGYFKQREIRTCDASINQSAISLQRRRGNEIIPCVVFVKFRVSFSEILPSYPPPLERKITSVASRVISIRNFVIDRVILPLLAGSMNKSLKIISQPTVDPSCRSMGDDVLSGGLTDFRGTSLENGIPFISSPFDIALIPFFADDTE